MQAVGGTVKAGLVVPDTPLPEGTRVEIFYHEALSPNVAQATASNGAATSVATDTARRAEEPIASEIAPEVEADLDFWYRNGAPLMNRIATVNSQAAMAGRLLDGQVATGRVIPAPPDSRQQLRWKFSWRWAAAVGVVLLILVIARLFTVRNSDAVSIRQRVVKGQIIEMTADAHTDAAGAMRALSSELWRSPRVKEVVLYYGQPHNLLIYDRQSNSLTAIPGVPNHDSPCGTLASGPHFNKVTDEIVHRVAEDGVGIDGIRRFCGAPEQTVENSCT
ncbi:MAG: hypothetical protein JO316_21885 [Abitibacteriaceae bacterium]|nr:hypothetical protein [Abditibacteriaceae bacterium]MBV9868016.1 hypothetical protein [Abditibacteriaceae bacterium]